MKSVLVALFLMAVGAAASLLFRSPRSTEEPTQTTRVASTARPQPRAAARLSERSDDDRQQTKLERQVVSLSAKVAEESAKRQRLEEQVQELTAQLAALAHGANDTARAEAAPSHGAAPPQDVAAAVPNPQNAENSSGIERALIAAGVDATTAGDIKRRRDQLVMDEIYLRNQATREEWMDTPRFRDELEAIEAQRTSIRDDIGDEAYDRYLFAQGQTNRVRVDDVLSDSVAAEAGLQTGDIVLRYGDTRIFGPEELVNETRSGRAGESIQLEVIRNGASLVVQVPRGPLGLRVAGAQGEPTS